MQGNTVISLSNMLVQGYKNGNYTVVMMEDGTKVRYTEEDTLLPAFPESIDVKITDRCDGGCPFCYEGCTPAGAHADLEKWQHFIDSLYPYTEVALNGNDLTHPQLLWLLTRLKEREVFANITVNQKHFIQHSGNLLDYYRRGLIHGLGISLVNPDSLFLDLVKDFPTAVIHVINGVVTFEQLEAMANKGLKILILGYKTLGRGSSYANEHQYALSFNESRLKDSLKYILDNKWFETLCFDNLALEQLDVKSLMSEEEWAAFYMGDDGEFTFYMDLVKGEFARNSMAPANKRYSIGTKTVKEMFQEIKKK